MMGQICKFCAVNHNKLFLSGVFFGKGSNESLVFLPLLTLELVRALAERHILLIYLV